MSVIKELLPPVQEKPFHMCYKVSDDAVQFIARRGTLVLPCYRYGTCLRIQCINNSSCIVLGISTNFALVMVSSSCILRIYVDEWLSLIVHYFLLYTASSFGN